MVGRLAVRLLLVALCLLVIFPFAFCVFQSFEGSVTLVYAEGLLPTQWTLNAYRALFMEQAFLTSISLTVTITALGTLISLALTLPLSYALSRKQLKARHAFQVFILITLIFHAGLIPLFLVVNSLRLLDTIWALVLPNAMGAYTTIILTKAFAAVPDSLEESAFMDGANDLVVFGRIYVPLASPMIAAMSLLYVVRQWNLFFDGVLYVNNPSLWPLQVLLNAYSSSSSIDAGAGAFSSTLPFEINTDAFRMAAIVVSSLPMILLYLGLQRYFVSGLTYGSVKE